jgi:hypothetical protein
MADVRRGSVWAMLGAWACGGGDLAQPESSGSTLLDRHCTDPGAASAFVVTDESVDPAEAGPDMIMARGDAVLMNDRAAFVILGPPADGGDYHERTYYHHAGIPVDGLPLEGCRVAGPDRLGEVGFVVGRLNILEFTQSNLRQFHGEAMRVVDPGGPQRAAVVEVEATDDVFWLVEDELIRSAWRDGVRRGLEPLWGLDVRLRYTLEPDSAVLGVEIVVGGDASTTAGSYLVGVVNFPSDRTVDQVWPTSSLSFGGFNLESGLPWLAFQGDTAYALGSPGARLARTEVSGAVALLDLNQVLSPFPVDATSSGTSRWSLALSPEDSDDAQAALLAQVPEPIDGRPASVGRVTGAVVDGQGERVIGATVRVEQRLPDGAWRAIASATTSEGAFDLSLISLLGGDAWRLVASAPGRAASQPLEVSPGGPVEVVVGPAGALDVQVRDADSGEDLPARVELLGADDSVAQTIWVGPTPLRAAVEPGRYGVRVTRGYEWSRFEGEVEVPAGGVGALDALLEHVVATPDWVALDSHVHQAGSGDSTVPNDLRVLTAAAAGLEAMIATDHEFISSLDPVVAEVGLQPWLLVVPGQEVTATTPEHINAWGFPTGPEYGPRGSPPEWFGQGLGEVYGLIRERGAGLIQLNHPRHSCNWMCLIGWDRVTGEPRVTDPTIFGLPPDHALWSWDLDAFEVMNGFSSPLPDPANLDATGLLEDWLAFWNHGHPVAPVGVTDSHDAGALGEPRTLVRLADDVPSLRAADVVDAALGGGVQVSAGAFVEVAVAGAGPGDVAVATSDDVALSLRVRALPEIDVTRVQILVNCDEVAMIPTTDPEGVVKLDTVVPLSIPVDAHVVVIGWGEGAMPGGFVDYDATLTPRVIANAIRVLRSDDPATTRAWVAPGGKVCTYTNPRATSLAEARARVAAEPHRCGGPGSHR